MLVRCFDREVCRTFYSSASLLTRLFLPLTLPVFLDLPAPWEALPSAVRTFKAETGGRIACFSPCIEQVQRTCGSLHQNGFRDIRLFEALIRPHEVRQMKILGAPVAATALGLEMPPIQTHYTTSRPLASCRGHTSYLTFATLSPRGGEGDGSGR
jgi:tRNA (adenine57-N1/adenine58-N1)-methyltransferase